MKQIIFVLVVLFSLFFLLGCIQPTNYCGNGICETGETPQNCLVSDGGDCSMVNLCGNGIVDAGEQCDDGGTVSLDGCSNNCTIEVYDGADGNNYFDQNDCEITSTDCNLTCLDYRQWSNKSTSVCCDSYSLKRDLYSTPTNQLYTCCKTNECAQDTTCVVEGWKNQSLNVICEGGVFTQSPLPSVTISLGAIKIQRDQYSAINLKNKINSLLLKHPNMDLIVTPEYTFYDSTSDLNKNSVTVICKDSNCSIISNETAYSKDLQQMIIDLQTFAREYKTNIVFGTIAEKEIINGVTAIFNSQLIIDLNGTIIGKKRKTTEWKIPSLSGCYYGGPLINDSLCKAVYASTLDSSISFNLKTRTGVLFKIAPVVCGERDSNDFLNRLIGLKADFIVNSESEGDCNYTKLTLDIQNKKTLSACWDWMINNIFIQHWALDRNIVKTNGYLLSSEGAFGVSGAVSLNKQPLQELEITSDYVYANVLKSN